MASAAHVDRSLLTDAAALTDPLGVLSVYAAVLPVEEAGATPRAAIELRHALEGASARLAHDADRSAAFDRRVRELEEDLDALVSPREPGQGRVLFAGLAGGDAVRAVLQVPLPSRVTVGAHAHLRPLAAAEETGRPAGVVLVSVDGLRLLEWRPREAVELGEVELVTEETGRELRGPADARPKSMPFAGTGSRSGGQRDLFERHVLLHREHRSGEEATTVATLARRRGWDEVLLVGDERMLRPLEEGIGSHGPELVVDHRLLAWLEPADLAAAVAEPLAHARARRRAALCAHIGDQDYAGGRGVLGVRDTLAALEEGRVERLVLAEADPLEPGAGRAAADPGEPDLADAMIARALATGALLTIVPSGEREILGAEPAAALLRW